MESVSVAYHRLHPMYGSVYKFLTSAPDAKGNTKHLYVGSWNVAQPCWTAATMASLLG